MAGQHNAEPNSSPAQWTNEIYDTTGIQPGLWSGDFLLRTGQHRQPLHDDRRGHDQWNQGALVHLTITPHPRTGGAVRRGDRGAVRHPLTDDQWTMPITDGADLNNAWKARLDTISVFFQELQDYGIQGAVAATP